MRRCVAVHARARLVEEGRRRQPEPVGRVDGRVAVDEQPVERVAPALPRHVQVAARQEARLPRTVSADSPPSVQVAGLGEQAAHDSPQTADTHCFTETRRTSPPLIAAMHPYPSTEMNSLQPERATLLLQQAPSSPCSAVPARQQAGCSGAALRSAARGGASSPACAAAS